MEEEKKIVILHILHAEGGQESGVRSIVPKHIEHQAKYAKVALLNCNNTDVNELKNICEVYKTQDIKDGRISNLPEPFNNPDLVVFHSIYYYSYIKLYKQCKKMNIPYIIVPHGSLTRKAQKQKWFKKIPANILLFNGYIKNAEAIQYLIEGEMLNSKKTNRYIIHGNGIEIQDSIKTYENKKDGEFQIIYVGRYDTYIKGLDLLVKAVNLIKNELRNNNMRIYLYGTDYRGRKKQIEELIIKNNINDLITVNGPLWGEEKVKKLYDADVFIQPSRTEAQSVGIMEAISIGIPCILTKETNYGEVVQKEEIGWMTETTPKGIADKILEAYNNQEKLEAMCKNGKKYAINNFDWNEIAKQTIDGYKKIINDRGV